MAITWNIDEARATIQAQMDEANRLDGVIDELASERDAAIARADAAGVYIERIRTALGGYEDSDLASLAETLRRRNEALEAEAEQMRTALRVAEQLTLRELQKSIAWRD